MKACYSILLATGLSAISGPLAADDPPAADELAQLRAELVALRQEYEQRISELEQRLAQAESAPTPQPAPVAPAPASSSGSNAFNPAIGVIFQGQAWSYQHNPEEQGIPGFPLGGEAGPVPEGFSLAETEIDISASVDDWFTAWLTMPVVIEDGETVVEIEEAWIETLSLPAGLAMRFGRFYSDIGYLNARHSHSWDFVDQPLPYQAFLGNQYLDDGVQARWVAPTDLYLELGAEYLRGDRYPAAGAANSGFGAWTLHARTGGDVGYSHSWLAGLSWLSADALGRTAGEEEAPWTFSGDSDLLIAEFTWKWAPNGNWKQRNFKFQTEYLWRDEQGVYESPAGAVVDWDGHQEGWYALAVYQWAPGWRLGLRYDRLSGDAVGAGLVGTPLDTLGRDPHRYSIMADWSHSEFSRLRLQYTEDRAALENDSQWGLQYIYSIGAHGAHSF